jgi:hypothetical protein
VVDLSAQTHRERHRVVPLGPFSVPAPYRGFAVRSEQLSHGLLARAPYAQVHLVHTDFLGQAALAGLLALGRARMQVREFGDIDYALVSQAELSQAARGVHDLVGQIADALLLTRVLGDDPAPYRQAVAARIDYLAAQGAGFHNDVRGHWTRCLFWNLALATADVEMVWPHASLRLTVAPGDLVVFDPTLAHGLCRPQDGGQALAASFAAGPQATQIFLSGELLLNDAQWSALGLPWLPVAQYAGALELMAAQFDEQTGAIQSPRSLAHCLLASTVYADGAADLS